MLRVSAVLTLWIALWIAVGAGLGYAVFGTPITGTVSGFFFALVTTFAWPWILPEILNKWMDGEPT